ncbi:MAG TPA: amino acid adenylation domain-containing protein [Longimicrobium sp.]
MDHTIAPPSSETGAAGTDASTPAARPAGAPRKLDLLARIVRENGAADADRIRPRAQGGPAPLSFGQERLWLLDQLDGATAAYNVPVASRLSGALNAAALERALGEIVRRHDVLRTTFAQVDDAPVQVVAPFAGFTLPVEDLSALTDEEREAQVRRRAADEAARPFDLAAGPLFRASLLRLADEEHVLLMCMHHIASDGWSMGVMFRELGALYQAYRDGAGSPLPELPVQYADYAVWQREQLAGERLERQLAWWKGQLAGAPALLELPTDHPRPAVQTYRGARERLELPGGLVEKLSALGQGEGATLYMVLLAAFQVLLSRYSGSDDVVVGTPIAGRARQEAAALIGFFANTLAVRTDLGGDPAFRELLRRVRHATLGAYEHQEVPFERLVAELQPERTLSHSPVFQVMFTLHNAERAGSDLAGLRVSGVESDRETSQFDLSLTLVAGASGLQALAVYSTDLFERRTVARMLQHLQRVLEQVAADADVRLSGLVLVDPAERAEMIHAWNQTERPWPRGVTIHQLFEAQVAQRPDAVALVWDDVELTYIELDAEANQLANHLVRLGVGPESRVGVLLERGRELVVSLLAVLKAGGCYVPLDPSYPAERLQLMLSDSGVRVMLSRAEFRGAVAAEGIRMVCLDEAADALAAEPLSAPAGGATADNLAYIVYTSGSSGRPKGVMVGHREIVQLVCETDFVRLRPGDRIAQASNASFDALAFEAWGAFLNGATLVGVGRDTLLSPPALRELLREQRITTLYQTTALLNQLTREQPDVFATLREVLFGGQASDAGRVRALVKNGKPQRLLHVYGPTETTAWCSFQDVRHVDEDALTVSVGRPIGNARIYILDAALHPVPVGVPGEAYVGGWGVVRGYLDRPSLTASRFVPDPFAAERGARMYRTGDRLRWKADGTLEFIGRVDEQVKIRGFRIEPGEVESALSALPDVREARVIVREDVPGEKRLVAYVVGEVDADGLRESLRQTLPDYMIPAAFAVMERLPLTPNGKLDIRALPVPGMATAEERYVAPRTPAEEVLAGIWAEVLRVERVGAHDGFFELGGHSLLATRVVSRVRALFAVELPVRALFETSTLAELADRVEALRRAGAPQLPPVVPVERTDRLPLSFAQERLWFLDRLQPGSAFYNVPLALRLTGDLDAGALERALGAIVRRHEALRTTFQEHGGAPVQVIAASFGFGLPVEDLSALADEEREARVRSRAAEEAVRPFDLAAGPLFRACLLRLSAGEHVLLMGMHHVVSDGWSMGVLFRELSSLYRTYRNGEESVLAPLAVQYADYAAWQRDQLRGEALERELAWWRERLAGAPAVLELPTDHPRPAVQTHGGSHERLELSAALLERLQALGRREGATLYMVLLGAFQVLLSKYSGSDDVVVGTPVAGRTRREVEELIGFFVNTLVLRTDLSGDPRFREVLGRVREVTLGAYEHQEVPFERLVEELQPERSLSHSPLFQVMFTVANADGAGPALEGVTMQAVESATETVKFDLNLAFFAGARGLRAVMGYRADLFERQTVRRMLGHLERVLEQVADDADVRLSRLELLGAAERGQVVAEWNRTESTYPADASIHGLFQEQAARTPNACAAVYGDRSLTYGELNERANRLAHHLAGLGVRPESRVAICMERGVDQVVAMAAVLKAGAAYVPLDPSYPAERLQLMLADSAVAALLTQESLRGALPVPAGVAVVPMDADGARIAAAPAHDPAVPAGPRTLAYVIYTSGSTGTPKGVAVEHRSVVRLVRGTDYVSLGAGDRVAQASNVSFDAATFEIWGALLNGGAVVGIPKEVALSPAGLADAIRAHSITTLFLTTALFNGIARERPDAFAPLTSLLFGGEAVDPAAVRRVIEAGGPRRLLHVYGPTENTTFSSWHPVDKVADGAQTVPIGRALAHSSLLVLDGALQPVPVGVPGELYVGGDGVARGYLGRAALTAERFVPDAFAARPGARMYRTGDRVRWTADGAIEYLARLDGQVKVRGFRIEVGEVEAVLRQHPGVRECAVLVREDAGEKRLAAYVAGDADAGTLRAHLRRTLPDYMVPAAFVSLDALPLTPNGKLDRKALPAPEYGAAEEYLAPRTATERALAAMWGEVLRLERVGVGEDFFSLGGHSLLATRVVSRIREVFGVEVPLRVLFEGPTVAGLSERVDEMRREAPPELPPVVRVARTEALPLSFAQERLWFLDRLQPESAFYNVSAAPRLSGVLDADALRRALGEVVRRHESLRTTFREVSGAPVQVIAPFAGLAVATGDLSHLPQAEREAEAKRLATEDARRPFDLEAGPLFRASLLRLGAEDHVLLLCMHHVVSDGWSLGILFRELSALYEAYRQGQASPLPELPVQYADFAVWQREHLRGAVLDRKLAYWRATLAGAPALLELPADKPRPAVQTYRGAREPVALPAELLERLEALAQREGATLYMVLLAAFQVLLGRYSGTEDIVVGSPIAGRTRAEAEALIGFFVNTLVLRTDLRGDPSFREVLRRVRDTTLGAYENQEVPFERLVEELQPERSLSHSPLVQVSFALQNLDRSAAGLTGLRSGHVEAELNTAKFDLTLALGTDARGLRGGLEYATDLFERGTIKRMVEHLERVLEQVAAEPDRTLSRLELMGRYERARVVEWNRTVARYPADRCIHQLFQAQAARTPDATAVIYGAETLTFRELDERANRLANHLVGMGVGPEVRVGLCLERGLEIMVAILGVMKAGGAYVPVDSAHPAERIGYVLADSGIAVLLTQDRLRGRVPPPAGVPVVAIDAAWERIAAESAEVPATGVTSENLAYVIYTSGSTGRPKGVAMHHRGVCNYIHWGVRAYGADQGTAGAPVFSSMAVDLTITNLLPLFTGRPLRFLPEEAPVEALAQALREAPRFGLIKITPIHVALLNTLLNPEDAPGVAYTLVIGADFLSAEPTVFWQEHAPNVRLMNEYGPTETVVGCSAYVLPNGRHRAGPVPVGHPIQNLRFYVLDAHMQPVPVGLPGELYIAGVGVARGYLGRPGLTAEKFLPDAFAEPGDRMYRTGDRARWLSDGNLMILGRTDNQVKIRGYRVELGEIEAVLRRRDEVRQCLVVVREDVPGDRRLVAYVVADDADPAELREHLRASLPEYMVPSAFVMLDALPSTPTGKLDPKTLPAPEYAGRAAAVAPRNELEQGVAEVWRDVLNLPEVGVHDNFFDLGGTSLLLYRVYSRLREMRADLRVVDLFRFTTVEALAGHLGAEASGGDALAESRSRAEERRASRRRVRLG